MAEPAMTMGSCWACGASQSPRWFHKMPLHDVLEAGARPDSSAVCTPCHVATMAADLRVSGARMIGDHASLHGDHPLNAYTS